MTYLDAVVIGAGAFGSSVALSLARRGKAVALLDRWELGEQTSSRAAGMTCHMKSHESQMRLSMRSTELLQQFAPRLELHQSGGLKLALTDAHAATLRTEMATGASAGLQIVEIEPADATRLAPYVNASSARAITFTPTDLYLRPSDLIRAYLDAAARAGVDLLPHHDVRSIMQDHSGTYVVRTSKQRFESETVVIAAGAWAGRVAALLGVELPLTPVWHRLLVTEPLPGVDSSQPIVRVVETNTYTRPFDGGLLFGGYEAAPREPSDADLVDDRAEPATTDLDRNVLRDLLERVAEIIPVLPHARWAEVRAGIPTMTADGNFLIDELPGHPGAFVVAGCNVAGLSTSPAVGELVAALVAGDDVRRVLQPFALDRFARNSSAELRQMALARYGAREELD